MHSEENVYQGGKELEACRPSQADECISKTSAVDVAYQNTHTRRVPSKSNGLVVVPWFAAARNFVKIIPHPRVLLFADYLRLIRALTKDKQVM